MTDIVNHPSHYTGHPSGVECIEITEHFNFNLGNAIKYIWRADAKGNPTEDLAKAEFYIRREIERREVAHSTEVIAKGMKGVNPGRVIIDEAYAYDTEVPMGSEIAQSLFGLHNSGVRG